MARFNCFTLQFGRKKKDKGDKRASEIANNCKEGVKTLQVEFEHPVKSSSTKDSKMTSLSIVVPFNVKENSKCKVEVRNHESPIGNAPEFAYEGEDEHEENSPMKRDFSDSDLHACLGNSGIEEFQSDTGKKEDFENRSAKDAETNFDQFQCGHLSDPGTGKAEFWASPELKRSCSNLETGDVLKKIAHELRTSKSQPFEELQGIERRVRLEMSLAIPGSPNSVMTHHSADRVMLKKHSSSQVLPSRSRRLWWKLFLWSHRNLHKPETAKPPRLLYVNHAFNQQGGYSSDTLEPNGNLQQRKLDSPGSFTGEESRNDGYDLWPQNQWVAFSTESSSFRRVEEWVKDLEATSPLPVESSNNSDDGNAFLTSPETGGSLARSTTHSFRRPNSNLSREVLHANSIVQSLNSSSTTAHISGTGLKVIPTISCFSGLRSVNLSSNLIVHITPGSLPKGLHTLSLSRNKITTIEGLRELTRLRILDLSYNRISRIGHGLSNCTLLKELYLAGNKISDVEGLHRLLKLTVLDLSFNKITTTKALGQLVGNYSSLLALNLLGNPIQSNISEDQLRKAISSLLPKLAYLNKQPVKPQMAREVLMDNVAKAAVRNGGALSSRRKAAKWGNQSAHKGGSLSTAHRSRSRSTSRSRHHQSPLKIRSSVLASSSHRKV